MDDLMLYQIAMSTESLITQITGRRVLTCMYAFMCYQTAPTLNALVHTS